MLGVGLDLVEIARIERAMRHPRFVQRILTDQERKRPLTPAYVAGRWAAKEAIAKCLVGVEPPPRWHEVEVLSNPDGSPSIRLASRLGRDVIHLSITHEHTHAAAVAIRSPAVDMSD